VEALLRRTSPNPFDIVFADPPYDLDSGHLNDLLTAVLAGGWVREGLVIVERSRRSARLSWPSGFARTWERSYGETVVEFGAVDSLSATEGEP
jgi:16S rRNA (guanine966-N2)-methyltransferase